MNKPINKFHGLVKNVVMVLGDGNCFTLCNFGGNNFFMFYVDRNCNLANKNDQTDAVCNGLTGR